MKSLVYTGKGTVAIQDWPKPTITSLTDAIIKLKHMTIYGMDLHIIKDDVLIATPGRILGHEGIGVIDVVGSSVNDFEVGDVALILCITACGACSFCRKGMPSHYVSGGWALGNTIDRTQMEYVRVPHAVSLLYELLGTIDLRNVVMLSNVLPTGLECGTLNGKVKPESTMAIIKAGAIGMLIMLML